jgi:8-oxo-dGTP diphosphatase
VTRIVAAAIIADGRLLSARRDAGRYAGRWEFPGGKVEAGEDDRTALARELREELGVEAAVGAQVGGAWPLADGMHMHVYAVALAPGARPRCLDGHDALRWLAPAQFAEVPWIPFDLPVLAMVAELDGMRAGRAVAAGPGTGQDHGMALLTADAIADQLPDGWTGDPTGLRQTLRYDGFAGALAAVNRIGEVAEEMDHHPDIDIRWNTLHLVVVSHSAGGVTEADLQLAARINAVA